MKETENKKPVGKAVGGVARAAKLSPLERRAIAKRAADARWSNGIPKATHTGELDIGGRKIPCAVLANGQRVLTQWGFYRAIGRSGRPSGGRGSSVEKVAPFLDLDNLKPFVSEELASSTKPIQFRLPNGVVAYGYSADLLPKVCEVYLLARDAKRLLSSQQKFATACDMLMRGLAHVGILALVDEATGFQEVRDKQALQAILDRFLRQELAAWAKRFPDEFYKHIFRLRGWTWKGMSVNRPQVVAKYTKDIVYARLAPGVLEELELRTPRDSKGRKKAAMHQWLTDDVGHPALAQHLHAVIGLMRISGTWDEFTLNLDKAFPKRGQTVSMNF